MNWKIKRNLSLVGVIIFVIISLVSNIFSLPPGSQRTWSTVEAGSLGDVNLFNGTLNMGIPILNIQGRGNVQVPLALRLGKTWRKYYYYWASAPGSAERYQINCAVAYLDGIPNGTQCTSAPNQPQPSASQIQGKIYPSTFSALDTLYNPGVLYSTSMTGELLGCDIMINGVKYNGYEPRVSRFVVNFRAPDGSVHELVDKNTLGKYRENQSRICGQFSANAQFSRGFEFVSTDGSGITFISDTEVTSDGGGSSSENGQDLFSYMSGMLYAPDGSQYRINNGSVSWIKDKDGNKTVFSYYTGSFSGQIHTITDSLGRTVTIEYNVQDEAPFGLCDRFIYKGFNGQDKIIRISKANLSDALRSGFTIQNASDLWHVARSGVTVDTAPVNPVVPVSLWLPDGKSYKFQYNSFVEVARVETPTGSAVEFDHDYALPGYAIDYVPLARKVTEKRIYIDKNSQSSLQAKTKYSRIIGTNTEATVDQTDANDNLLSRTKSYFYGNPRYFDATQGDNSAPTYGMLNWKEQKEYKTEYFANDGTTLSRKVLRSWKNKTIPWLANQEIAPPYDTRLTKQVSITVENGQALAVLNKTEYDENDAVGSTDIDYFSHLNVKKSKAYNYKFLDSSTVQNGDIEYIAELFSENNLASVSETDYRYDAGYKARHILGLPFETRVMNPASPTQTLSKNQVIFDEQNQYYSMTDLGSATNYEVPTGNYASLRGDITTKRTWYAEENRWIETHTQYDNFGNIRRVWDSSGDQNRFVETEYSADYQYAYATKIITPAPDPTGVYGTNQGSFATTAYDFYTGLPISTTNELGQTTATQYDALLRPTRVYATNFSMPETRFEYSDIPGNLSSKVKKQIDVTNWDEVTTFIDGLGRTIKTQAKDSQGDVFTETQYDNFGRIKQTSNPYRQGETVYWSKPRYDELSRIVETYAPAPNGQTGASLGMTSYAISTVANYVGIVDTTSDASGRKRRSITNSLEQVIRIDEPQNIGGIADADLGSIATPLQPTYYKYDERGNLKEVNQGEQTRTFTYDSFSRIKSAANPESGTVNYTYDIFGNLKTKRDARGIKTIYDYDKAKRIVNRCYRVIGTGSLGATNCADAGSETVEPNTPDVNYFYDGKGLSNPQTPNYAKGKLTKISSLASATLYTSFDYAGRVLTHQQITNDQIYSTSYKYNFKGALIEETYPSGKIVRNFYDTDGDLSQVVKNGKKYASDFSYTAAGAIQKMRLGNGNWESAVYNERLQPTEFGLGTSQTTATNLWKINYEYGELNADGTTVNAAKNNGNIAKQVITVPTVGSTQGFVATQTYIYDSINRLKQAKEMIPNQTGWKQTFDYDRFGNRTFNEANTTTLPKACLVNNTPAVCEDDHKSLNPTPNQSNNRLKTEDSYEYDANGNLTKDAEGKRFTYDALNKQTEVKNISNQSLGKYVYDGEGNRIKKIGNLENTLFVYDAFGSLIAEYAIDNSQPITSPQISYLTTDTLGSPRVVTGKNGEVLSRRDFLPFGEEIIANENNRKSALGYNYSNTSLRQSFTGYEKDAESGLDFAQNRYYSNQLGRFTTPDPMMASGAVWNPQTWNRYAYVGNNPINITDPLGLLWAIRPGETFYTWFKDKDAMDAAGGYTEAASYIYQIGDTIYTLHPTLNTFSTAATNFAEAARIFVQEYGGSAAAAETFLVSVGVAASEAAVITGALAVTVIAAKESAEVLDKDAGCMMDPAGCSQLQMTRMYNEAVDKEMEQIKEMVPEVVDDLATNASSVNMGGSNNDPNNDPNRPTVNSRIKESKLLTKEAESAARDQSVQRDLDNLSGQLANGNMNPGKGNKPLFNGIIEARGQKGGRVYFRNTGNNSIEILAKSSKANQSKVINELRKLYGN